MLGLLLSTVGIDVTLGFPRFNFGSVDLLSGISFIPVMIGLFGVSEVVRSAMKKELHVATGELSSKGMFSGALQAIRRHWRHLVRSAPIGTVIGALPGAGADIAAWVTYAIGKNLSKEPDKYGKGYLEPIVAASSANNAAVAGAWVPALVFGIPGDTVTAILIGVLYMKGLRPGPEVFQKQTALVYGVYVAFLLSTVLLVPFSYLAVRNARYILRIPRNVLMPIILTFCIVGAYSINNSLFDVAITLVMGILGYILEEHGFPLAPIVLGVVLGPIVEQNFMLSVMKTGWHFEQFFGRPISAVLLVLAVLTWTWPMIQRLVRYVVKRRQTRVV